MIRRLVRLHIQPDKISEFTIHFAEQQNAIANYPGCLSLQLYRDKDDSTILYTWSEWISEDSLFAYRNSELFKTTWSKVKPLFSKPAKAQTLLLERNVK